MYLRAVAAVIASLLTFGVVGPIIGGLTLTILLIPVKGLSSLTMPAAYFLFFPGAYAIGIFPAVLAGLGYGLIRTVCWRFELTFWRNFALGFALGSGTMLIGFVALALFSQRGGFASWNSSLLFLGLVGAIAGGITASISRRLVSRIYSRANRSSTLTGGSVGQP